MRDVSSHLCIKTAMKSTMPFVDRGDIEKVEVCDDNTLLRGEGLCGA